MKKYDELVKEALEMIDNDDELLIDLVNELDSWNGFADGFRAWPMDELGDFYAGSDAMQLLKDLTSDFNRDDNYFYYTIYGLESTDDPAELYRNNCDEGDVLDNVINYYNHLYFYNKDFEELINDIVNYTDENDGSDEKEAAAV